MSRILTISADIEREYTLGLRAKVVLDDFSGSGDAWFNTSEVRDFIIKLRDFVTTMEKPPSLQGGVWDRDGNLSEVLLSFRFYSFSDYRFGVHIHLANRPSTDARVEEVSRVEVELQPTIHEVTDFCDDMDRLLSNKQIEAKLTYQ